MANSPPPASRSPPPPSGKTSRPRAPTPHPTRPPPPGPTSCDLRADTILACDFIETITLTGRRQYILAVIEHITRRIRILATTAHPTAAWVTQTARNLAMDLTDNATLTYLARDRDAKYPSLFDQILADAGIQVVRTGIRIPRMNAITEHWVQPCRHELLDHTLIWNERHLRHALRQFDSTTTSPAPTKRCIRQHLYALSPNRSPLHRSPTSTYDEETASAESSTNTNMPLEQRG
jgi:hypothetical protein